MDIALKMLDSDELKISATYFNDEAILEYLILPHVVPDMLNSSCFKFEPFVPPFIREEKPQSYAKKSIMALHPGQHVTYEYDLNKIYNLNLGRLTKIRYSAYHPNMEVMQLRLIQSPWLILDSGVIQSHTLNDTLLTLSHMRYEQNSLTSLAR